MATGDNDRGGGGGSSYILTESSIKPSGYLLDSKYYMTNTVMLSGNTSMPNPNGGMMIGKTGNGFIRIIKL